MSRTRRNFQARTALASMLTVFAIAAGVAACSGEKEGEAENQVQDPLDLVWSNWFANDDNHIRHRSRFVDVKGRLIRHGTVPPSSMGSLVKGRLPAYLACYDLTEIWPSFERRNEVCIFYIYNEQRNEGQVTSRWATDGEASQEKIALTELFAKMREADFVDSPEK